ncbi:MAG: methyltransferase [Verrucomicrobia bacterium]|nr:methyltransferase [Verrucomicrobiota bacterium]
MLKKLSPFFQQFKKPSLQQSVFSFKSGTIPLRSPQSLEEALVFKKAFMIASKIHLAGLIVRLNQKTNRIVQAGPFRGMKLVSHPEQHSLRSEHHYGWDAHQLLGCLEEELHSSIEQAIQRAPEVVVNVGCGEGYYAIGLAKRLPHAEVYAFDSSKRARELCQQAAKENHVADRVHVKGACHEQEILKLASIGKRIFFLIDCEGDEIKLLTPRCVEALHHADVIVECHDFENPKITPTLLPLFMRSHRVEMIKEGARNPSDMPLLQDFSSFDRWLCMCEFRPRVMWWLVCWGR